MNPWGIIFMALGLLIIIIGVKGSYKNLISAITNKPESSSTTNTSNTTPVTPSSSAQSTPSSAAAGQGSAT